MAEPRDKTLEVKLAKNKCNGCRMGYHHGGDRKCSWCGATDRHPAKRIRRRIINGKRGRNSGTTNTAKTK